MSIKPIAAFILSDIADFLVTCEKGCDLVGGRALSGIQNPVAAIVLERGRSGSDKLGTLMHGSTT